MTGKTLKVLLVEDNAGDVRLLREMFSNEKADSFELTHLVRMSDAEAHLAKGEVDILLLDMGLPDAHGIETVRRARAVAPGVPLIVLTGLEDEALAAAAMKEGAQDYLIKGQIENRALPRALRHAIERQRMQMETDRVRSLQMQLKDEFLSHVSHELRAPLASIYSFSSIIADGLAGDTSQEQNEYLEIIQKNVQQLQAMIEDLLLVTQAQTGQLTVDALQTPLSDGVGYAIDTLSRAAKAKNITVTFESPANPQMGYADPTRLRQILTILLDNALKFTPIGGAVKIGVERLEEDPTFLRVEVSDTGCGIAADAADHIFERLNQVSGPGQAGRNGLGLGLYIARELVTRHGGKIWVSSAPGQGSHFFFTLPVFSLESLIGPILKQEQKRGDTIAVLAVEITSCVDTHPVTNDLLSATRTLLKDSLRTETDVILPSLDATHEGKFFLILSCTKKESVEIVASRIVSQLQRSEELKSGDFSIRISHNVVDTASRTVDESMESFAGTVAAGIRTAINKS
jgi:signal transduction histidine kinase